MQGPWFLELVHGDLPGLLLQRKKNSHIQGHAYLGPVRNGACMQVSWPALLMEAWLDIAHEIHEGSQGFHRCTQEHI